MTIVLYIRVKKKLVFIFTKRHINGSRIAIITVITTINPSMRVNLLFIYVVFVVLSNTKVSMGVA